MLLIYLETICEPQLVALGTEPVFAETVRCLEPGDDDVTKRAVLKGVTARRNIAEPHAVFIRQATMKQHRC